jgi:hypothetical protein
LEVVDRPFEGGGVTNICFLHRTLNLALRWLMGNGDVEEAGTRTSRAFCILIEPARARFPQFL